MITIIDVINKLEDSLKCKFKAFSREFNQDENVGTGKCSLYFSLMRNFMKFANDEESPWQKIDLTRAHNQLIELLNSIFETVCMENLFARVVTELEVEAERERLTELLTEKKE